MDEYKNLVYYRDETVEGTGGWWWPKVDTGLWEGPKQDCENEHSKNVDLYVKNKNVVVQAGGGCGVYPRLLAAKFQRVYTFEPHYLSFFCLNINCQAPNVFKLQAALGNEPKLISLKLECSDNLGTNIINGEGIIPMLTIDNLKLDTCDLIWLDIEGYEKNAIDGALETIKKFMPVLILENGYGNGIPLLLESLGYDYKGKSACDSVFVPR